ncbi:MAG: hypothetical protein IKQ36_03230 [Clostridia bacterium]|nr:hypothetical protein [Clostridia bacterium]
MDGLNDLDLLGGVDNEYVDSARKAGKTRRRLRTAVPAAAGLCLALTAGIVSMKLIGAGGKKAEYTAAVSSPHPVESVGAAAANTPEVPPVQTSVPADPEKLYLTLSSSGDSAVDELGENELEWGIDYRMFIYGGRVYFHCFDADPLSDTIDQKLGTVELFDFKVSAHVSTVDEDGSSADGEDHPYIVISENEQKGTVCGNFYSVKGEDPERLLCMRPDFPQCVQFYICGDDLISGRGSDLLEGVLHVSERISEFRYCSNNEGDPTVGRFVYAIGTDSEELGLFLEALDSGVWVDDTRHVFSRYYNEEETSPFHQYSETDPGLFSVTLTLENGVNVDLTVYKDGVVTFPYSFNSKALKIDREKAAPLWKLMMNNSGKGFEYSDDAKLAECKKDSRFGEAVPDLIPKGYHIRNAWIEYVTDRNTGAVTGTDHIRIEYKNPRTGAIMDLWIMPVERKDTDYMIGSYVKKGARIVDVGEFGENCMYKEYGKSIGDENEVYTFSVVTYRDAVIYVEAFETQPKVIVELIRSIGG